MEDKYLIVGHPLLCNNDFLASIDDEVPSLIVLAIFSCVNSIISVQVAELAELRS